MRMSFLALVAALLLSAFTTSSFAEGTDEINKIIRGLAPIAGQSVAESGASPLLSPASGLGSPASDTVLVEVVLPDRIILVDTSYAIDFEVYFPFDSAELTPMARQELQALGQALASVELRPYRYLVAGHTDAIGKPSYNLRLSMRRAAAVRKFLIEAFPIMPDRLASIGFGQEKLKLPSQPQAGINRRVEVLLIARQ
jgi:outer membrane protein OmpA-like peptidoglycan-associated protein